MIIQVACFVETSWYYAKIICRLNNKYFQITVGQPFNKVTIFIREAKPKEMILIQNKLVTIDEVFNNIEARSHEVKV